MAIYGYEIGTTSATTNLEDLTTPVDPPKSTFEQYSDAVDLGDSTVRGLGYPVATWRWGFIPQDQYDQLRTYCSGKSAEVYIVTVEDDGTYTKYSCVMIWPDMSQVEKQSKDGEFKYMDFVLTFRHLEAA